MAISGYGGCRFDDDAKADANRSPASAVKAQSRYRWLSPDTKAAEVTLELNVVMDADGAISISTPHLQMDSSASVLLAPDDDAEADSLFTFELDVVTDADGAISISAPCCIIVICCRW